MADHFRVTFADVITAHDHALRNGGGVPGINSKDLIHSALGRPYQEYDGQVFYPTVIDKAGCLLHGFLNNHGFKDANKRTAWIVCNAFLYTEIHVLILPEDYPWYDKLAQMVDEHWDVQRVIAWVEHYAKSYDSYEAMVDDV
ncbi:type II toxin-antitoxin system death-on-curing family toxin [Tateyamaria omphalii]|uniref:Fido domain-containing protein n=1 Tax=Tateyamaria omphalii TaxID=299262 RepID=A0A1P8N1S2_9RHOB|nr:Fic family protein [Tateyamaria omphalii]APX14188.1 hypothetical protein BWR18_20210 [Tateyamaria omphalii]